MRFLVLGAGNIGSLYAAKLAQSGQEVTVLARGARLEQIRRHGIELEDAVSGERTRTPLRVVDRLGADDAYDVVLVILPKQRIAEVLPVLAANDRTPSVMFFGNNAAGPAAMTDALGHDRVLLGFPGAAAVPHDGAIRYVITSAREQPTTLGELDGSKSKRILAIASALEAAGFPVSVSTNIDAWLKTHVAKILPMVCALFQAGSAWPHDTYFLSWRPWFPILFYEQGFKKDIFVLRFGNLSPPQFLDFFRFKDPRTSFSGGPFTGPVHINPLAPPGFGIQFDLRPIKNNELYFTGLIHDQNARPEVYSWNEFFTKGNLYYGLEIGYFWRRAPADFDHLHVNVIYADAPAEANPTGAFLGVGNEPGWVLKAHGSKQIDRWVVYGNYTYNTSQGGPFGLTVADHSVAGGLAFLRPFHVNGEWSLGAVWAKPINRALRDQYGIETYWKILFAEDLWVTPNLQLIFNPTYNTRKTVLAVGGIKLRLFF